MGLREAAMLLFFLNFDLGSAVQISKFYASVRTSKAWLGLQLASQGGCSDINVISVPWLTLTIVHQSETKFPLVISSKACRKLISVIAQWQCLGSNSCMHSRNPYLFLARSAIHFAFYYYSSCWGKCRFISAMRKVHFNLALTDFFVSYLSTIQTSTADLQLPYMSCPSLSFLGFPGSVIYLLHLSFPWTLVCLQDSD